MLSSGGRGGITGLPGFNRILSGRRPMSSLIEYSSVVSNFSLKLLVWLLVILCDPPAFQPYPTMPKPHIERISGRELVEQIAEIHENNLTNLPLGCQEQSPKFRTLRQ